VSITLDQITKRYRNTPVVNDVSLEVADGEFFVLLGPSGSGKSTLLRAIAGLTGIDHGRIGLHGRDVTELTVREREVGFVFQSYALFRHMTVSENIEFSLRVRRVKAAERRERRRELLRLVALEGMDDRLPSQLSGGQQQRVAVARALAHKPKVLLLDEPFGALDAKIREELRRTFRQVQRELGITTILVTHDQEEAFALADRIGIMHQGRLLEVGRPDALYTRPSTRFVASFLGAANVLLTQQTSAGVRLGCTAVRVDGVERVELGRSREVVAVLRPEEIEVATNRDALEGTYIGQAVIDEMAFTGALERLRVRMADAVDVIGPGGELATAPTLEVSRPQHEQRRDPFTLAQRVSVGVRRVHLLGTPLSSFTACAGSLEHAQRLAAQPLLAELAARMRTRVTTRVEPAFANGQGGPAVAAADVEGVAVIEAGAHAVPHIERLLESGVGELLWLPQGARLPGRVLIHCIDDAARAGTLAVAASVLRHLSAEAIYYFITPSNMPERERSLIVRRLLDTRSESRGGQGLDIRTELLDGDAAEQLALQLAGRDGDDDGARDQMLILGTEDSRTIAHGFERLLASAPACPILVVHRPGGQNPEWERPRPQQTERLS
jgi:sulfate transport system ATP-binding protein